MSDVSKLKTKLEYHREQIARIQTAIDVLLTIDDNSIAKNVDNQAVIIRSASNAEGVPNAFDISWTYNQKVAFLFHKLGRCAVPSEIEILYNRSNDKPIKNLMINQVLNGMRAKGLIKSYKPDFQGKSYAWGLADWFNGDLVIDEYKAKKPERTLWD